MHTVRALLLAIALAATACSSDSDTAIEVESPTTTAVATTTEAPSSTAAPSAPDTDPVAEPVAAIAEAEPATAEPADGAIVIETEVDFGSTSSSGIFLVGQGAELLGCNSGTVVALRGDRTLNGLAWDTDQAGFRSRFSATFTCDDGDREGTFTFVWSAVSRADGPWTVLDATGDFAGLTGEGWWSGTLDVETPLLGEFPGVVQFGPAGPASTEADPALVADVAAYAAALGEGDGNLAWSMVSTRCQGLRSEMLYRGWVDFVFSQAPGLVATDVSALVFGDTAAVTYIPTKGVSDDEDASQRVPAFPLVAQPWVLEDGNWHQDDC